MKKPCRRWKGAHDSCGYGQKHRNGKTERVHVIAYEDAHGPVPEGCEVDHECGTRDCFEPTHLRAVSHAENCRAGRSAKLTRQRVEQIRTSTASNVELARALGVHDSTVSRIRTGKAWAEAA